MQLSENEKRLLKKFNWDIEFFESETSFSVIHHEGSSIVNCKPALDGLIQDLIIEENEENTSFESTESILSRFGYYFICESPKEIGHLDDESVFVSGSAAVSLVEYLRNK